MLFLKPCSAVHPLDNRCSQGTARLEQNTFHMGLDGSAKDLILLLLVNKRRAVSRNHSPHTWGLFFHTGGGPMDQRVKASRRVIESSKCSWCGWVKAGRFWTPDRRSPSVAMHPDSVCPGCREDFFSGSVAPRDTGSWLGH